MKSALRKNMLPEECGAQLLRCAQILFFSKGLADASSHDVLDPADVSNGGTCHPFSPTDEPLFGVLDGAAEGVASQMAVIISDETSSDLELLRTIGGRRTSTANHAAEELQATIDMQFLTIDRILDLPDGIPGFGWPEAFGGTMAAEPPPPPIN